MLAQGLIDFIASSPTPFHATATIAKQLEQAGFIALNESEAWDLQVGQGYYVTRNNSSIIAFYYGDKNITESGIRMVGAHTDSPCLKVKPNADLYRQGYWQVGVEIYGGVLLAPWFDRDLSLAGRVSAVQKNGEIVHLLIDFEKAIGMVPSLAIHLDRDANENRSINKQKDLPVLLAVDADKQQSFKTLLLEQAKQQHPELDIEQVLDYEMSFYDIQAGSVYGVQDDFVAASRLDNLLSCYIGLQALLKADGSQNRLLVCNDHEEVGSQSAAGAAGPFLESFLQRILPDSSDYHRAINASMMISADNAHAIHPNFSDKHDAEHGPLINQGPVIKINANQRYASNSETQAIFRHLCEQNNIPVQSFVVRSDMACGSTIGPITAGQLGVRTLDIGVPTFAMHSIRETAGTDDLQYLFDSLRLYLMQ